MMFKVGDKIKVVKKIRIDNCTFPIGETGIIRGVDLHSYCVEWPNFVSPYLHTNFGLVPSEKAYNIHKKHFGKDIVLSIPNWKARLTPGGKNDK